MPFQFKKFAIEQSENSHKVGTDSMVLGAWCSGKIRRGLDIGTGTGILALMTAQKNPDAFITAIEPNLNSFNEASLNFKNSPYSNRINCVESRLQDFKSENLFDFIICNPPYFIDSTLSKDKSKNNARHTVELSIDDLYFNVSRLMSPAGQFNIVFPSDLLDVHLRSADKMLLYPREIFVLENENKKAIRHIIKYSKEKKQQTKSRMVVKYASGIYSKEYVILTSDFHSKVLPFKD